MSSTNPNPVNFTREQLQLNLEAQRKLHDLLPLLDDAEQCGVPVDGYRAIAAGLKDQLEKIRHKFMPGVGS